MESAGMNESGRLAYREEARELLGGLEAVLLELEARPEDLTLVHDAFRKIHTIKGSGAMFGFDRVATFTHDVETAFDLVRTGALPVTLELISLTLRARDHLSALVEAEFGGPAVEDEQARAVLEGFRALVGAGAAPPPVEEPAAGPELVRERRTFRIRFRPPRDAFLKGTNLLLLLDGLRELGPCTVVAQSSGLPPLESFDPECCYLAWDVVLTTEQDENAIHDVFLFVEDESELQVEPLDPPEPVRAVPRLGEILVARGDVRPEAVTQVIEERPKIGQLLIERAGLDAEVVQSALAEQQHLARNLPARASAPEPPASVRVTAEKLDSLVNTVGELVTVQARLKRLAALGGGGELGFLAEEFERLTNRLRSDTMSVRMLPIGATFARFRRLARDLARDLGKQIELTVEGAETELDKNVIEQLNDPLVHIIRNSADHGIEMPEERKRQGKPAHGTIHLSAIHSGAHVLIRIADDGAGLDRAAILAKARANGLLGAGDEPADEEVFQLIFRPGFSTAKQVTGLSGRGVGLDVVSRSIGGLRGSIDVRSTPGRGSSFTLKIPLTLAIIDGLLVSVEDRYYVLPLSNIVECVELSVDDVRRLHGRRLVNVRGELVPYLILRDYFSIPGEMPAISQVILAETEGGKFGVVVDRVIGDHQTMVKSLGLLYRQVEAVSGATILGDGAVAVILDLEKLVREVVRHAA